MLGMTHTVFKPATSAEMRHALSFGNQKINLHESGKEFEPKAGKVTPGSADLAFLTDDAVEEVAQRLRASDIVLLEDGAIVRRTGARGTLKSCYCRDPDGNLIESVTPCFGGAADSLPVESQITPKNENPSETDPVPYVGK